MSERSCPCHWTTPCMERCTCANPNHSGGCMRCCAYGDAEERRNAAIRIVTQVQQATESANIHYAAGVMLGRLRAALRQAYERMWANIQISSTRGDCNCPHPVSYHPGDGHGFEEFADTLELDVNGATLESEWDRHAEEGGRLPANRDPIVALCELLERMPEIKDRALIERGGA